MIKDERGEEPRPPLLHEEVHGGDDLRGLSARERLEDGLRRVEVELLNEGVVCDGFLNLPCINLAGIPPGGLPGPRTDASGERAPETGLIVKFNKSSSRWQDPLGRNWTNQVKFNLPDKDVFVIDASAPLPDVLPGDDGFFAGVGTTLFTMIVNPVSGSVYVTNTEARNHVRFEGPGEASSTVRGHFVEARITVIAPDGTVSPRHLNNHIASYGDALGTAAERALSLATPLGMAVTADGKRLYLAAFGSRKLAWYSTAELASVEPWDGKDGVAVEEES